MHISNIRFVGVTTHTTVPASLVSTSGLTVMLEPADFGISADGESVLMIPDVIGRYCLRVYLSRLHSIDCCGLSSAHICAWHILV